MPKAKVKKELRILLRNLRLPVNFFKHLKMRVKELPP